MKKILPLLVVGILVLSGLGAVAVPDKHTTPEPLLQPELKIGIRGGFFGYYVTVTNIGNETISGTLNMSITTDTWFMLFDNKTSTSDDLTLMEDEDIVIQLGLVVGFGPATISVSGIFMPGGWGFSGETTGFVLLIFVVCGLYTPPWE